MPATYRLSLDPDSAASWRYLQPMREPAVAEEPGDRPFDLPSVSAETLAGLDAGPGDARNDAPLAQPLQPLSAVVRLVGAEPARAASARTAPGSEARYAEDQRKQCLAVVDVRTGDAEGEG